MRVLQVGDGGLAHRECSDGGSERGEVLAWPEFLADLAGVEVNLGADSRAAVAPGTPSTARG